MKKELLFILFIVIAVFLFDKFYTTGFVSLKIGENTDIEGKTVIIKQISSNSVVVDINGVSDIVNTDETKEINGVKISIDEIFFVDEKEDRFVKLTLTSLGTDICGNEKCESGETKDNCCKDCSCNTGYLCENNGCILEVKSSKYDECKNDDKCDDKNESTIDKCEGTPKKCTHKTFYQCLINEECNDKNECTKDECKNKECFNTKIPECKTSNIVTKETQEVVKIEEQEKGFLSRLFSKLFGWL